MQKKLLKNTTVCIFIEILGITACKKTLEKIQPFVFDWNTWYNSMQKNSWELPQKVYASRHKIAIDRLTCR